MPVPQFEEDGFPVFSQELVQNRTLEQIVDEPAPPVMEAALEVMRATPQECVLFRPPEQLVDVPVPQITKEIVERPVPSERIRGPIVEQIRDLSEVVRRFCEQNAFEEEEEDGEEEEISRFLSSFPSTSLELHPDSW